MEIFILMILSAIENDNGLDHIYFAAGIINDPSGLKHSSGYALAMSRYATLSHNRPERIRSFVLFQNSWNQLRLLPVDEKSVLSL